MGHKSLSESIHDLIGGAKVITAHREAHTSNPTRLNLSVKTRANAKLLEFKRS